MDVETAGTLTAGETVGYRKAPMRKSPPMANVAESKPVMDFKANARVALDVHVEPFLKMLVDRIGG